MKEQLTPNSTNNEPHYDYPEIYTIEQGLRPPQQGTQSPPMHHQTKDWKSKKDGLMADEMDSFDDKGVQRLFLRKVYAILSCQLLLGLGAVFLFSFYWPIFRSIYRFRWTFYASLALYIATALVLLLLTKRWRRMSELVTWLLLLVITAATSLLLGTMSAAVDTTLALILVVSMMVVCLGFTLFTCQAKLDFTICSGLLTCTLLLLGFFVVICSILPNLLVTYLRGLVACAVIATVHQLFMVYHTTLMMAPHGADGIRPREYALAALWLNLTAVYVPVAFVKTLLDAFATVVAFRVKQ